MSKNYAHSGNTNNNHYYIHNTPGELYIKRYEDTITNIINQYI